MKVIRVKQEHYLYIRSMNGKYHVTFCQLNKNLDLRGMKKYQSRNCFHQIGLITCLWDILLTYKWCRWSHLIFFSSHCYIGLPAMYKNGGRANQGKQDAEHHFSVVSNSAFASRFLPLSLFHDFPLDGLQHVS